jgi:hypothetical protein
MLSAEHRPGRLDVTRQLDHCSVCSPALRQAKARQGSRLRLALDALPLGQSALRCSVSWPRHGTHCANCVRSVRTPATSQLTMRASRGAMSPALLGVSQALRWLPCRAFARTTVACHAKSGTGGSRQVVPGGGDFCGDEKRRLAGGARSALRELTRRRCPNGANAVRAVSLAPRPQAEHHSAVGAKRRPPQHEPPAGTACRDARLPTLG